MSVIIDENTVKETFGESPNVWSQFKLKLLELLAGKADINGGVMESDPTEDLGITTKQYVDGNIKYLYIDLTNALEGEVIGEVPNWKDGDEDKYIAIAKGFLYGNGNFDTVSESIFAIGEPSDRIGQGGGSQYVQIQVATNGEISIPKIYDTNRVQIKLFLIPAKITTLTNK